MRSVVKVRYTYIILLLQPRQGGGAAGSGAAAGSAGEATDPGVQVQLVADSSRQLITEQSSLLLSTITSMNALGPLRRPLQAVPDQLKQMNTHYKLGHLLCRSRQPDFLLDIIPPSPRPPAVQLLSISLCYVKFVSVFNFS